MARAAGPASGHTSPRGLSAEELKKYLFGAKMVRCDEAAWTMLGISMAGWNAHPLGWRWRFVLASGVTGG